MAVLGDTGDAGGVSMVAGKSLPLVRVALSLVNSVEEVGLAPPATAVGAGGLRADSAVCVLQSRVGGLAEVAAVFVVGVVGGADVVAAAVEHGLLALLLGVRLGAAPRTMSDSLLLAAVAGAGAVRAEELSSGTAPWLNDSSSRKPGRGGKAASSRSNLGASGSSLDLLLSALPPSGLEPFSSFFLRRIRLSWYFCEEPPPPPPESLPVSPLGLPLGYRE